MPYNGSIYIFEFKLLKDASQGKVLAQTKEKGCSFMRGASPPRSLAECQPKNTILIPAPLAY